MEKNKGNIKKIKEIPEVIHGPKYLLAHRLLPQLLYKHPQKFTNLLSNEQIAEKALNNLWKNFLSDIKVQDEDEEFSFKNELINFGKDKYGCLIEMPQPKQRTEVFYVMPIWKVKKSFWKSEDIIPINFLTLELGFTFPENQPFYVLCSWSQEGTHSNYGELKGDPKKGLTDAGFTFSNSST